MKSQKELVRLKRHRRLVLRMHGTPEVPRLIIHRSLKNLQVQMVDDTAHKTLFSLSTLDKEMKQKFPCAGNIKAAELFGEIFARRAIEKGFQKIIFDRGGYLYHGRIKAFADSLRKGGLKF